MESSVWFELIEGAMINSPMPQHENENLRVMFYDGSLHCIVPSEITLHPQ